MAEMQRDQFLDYLRQHHVMTLSTAGLEGVWATPVFYAHREFDLFFVSDPGTRHGRNIGQGAQVAAAITDDRQSWQSIRGIQCEGRCEMLPEPEVATARKVFLAKYPFAALFLHPSGPMYKKAGSKVRFYRLRLQRLYLVDNSVHFGYRAEYLPRVPGTPSSTDGGTRPS